MSMHLFEPLSHPDPAELMISDILKALGDPTRLRIVASLAAAEAAGRELSCTDLGCSTKQLATHHLRTLRESGIVFTREDGRRRFTRLRREAIDLRFPGLLDAIIANAQ